MSFSLFEPDNRLLPGLCKPYTDELLSSWLSRMAYNHGLGLKQFFTHIWPEYGIKNDIDRCITKEQLVSLAAVTNCTFEEVKATTLFYYENTLLKNMHDNRSPESWVLPGNRYDTYKPKSYYSTGLMFCPKCLAKDGEKPYFRKHWRLAISFICVECGCYLMDECPHCHKGNSFLDVPISQYHTKSLTESLIECHNCGKPVIDCEVKYAPKSLTALQRKLYDMIKNGIGKPSVSTQSYFSVLYDLASMFLTDTYKEKEHPWFTDYVMYMHGLSQEAIRPYTVKFLRRLPVQKRAILIDLAYWMLEDWPGRLVNLCKTAFFTAEEMCSLLPRAPDWFKEPLEMLPIWNKLPEIDVSSENDDCDTDEEDYYEEDEQDGYVSEYTIKTNVKPTFSLDYDIDLNNKYYTYDNDEYFLYEDIQSQYCSYSDDDQYPDDDLSNIQLLKNDRY